MTAILDMIYDASTLPQPRTKTILDLPEGDEGLVRTYDFGAPVERLSRPIARVVFQGRSRAHGWALSLIRLASGAYELAHITPLGEVAIAPEPPKTLHIPATATLADRDAAHVDALLAIAGVAHAEIRQSGTTQVVRDFRDRYGDLY